MSQLGKLLVSLTLLLLAACGGGGAESTAPPPGPAPSPQLTWDQGNWNDKNWQ